MSELGEHVKNIAAAVISAAVISFGSIAVTHTLTVNVLQERVSTIAKEVAEHEQRIARLEETLAKVGVRVEQIDRNTRISANAARDNSVAIGDVSDKLNRVLGYIDAREKRQ